jgi:hypothetical protein
MKTRTIIILSFAVLIGSLSKGSLSSLSQSYRANRQTADDSQLPIADLNAPEASDPRERALRTLRSKRHDITDTKIDIKRFQLNDESPSILLSLPSSHAPKERAFPVAESDVIVIGQITDAHAYLSNDKTSVYSEFVVSIQQVPRDKPGASVPTGSSLVVQRPGGRVRLKSGKLLLRGAPYGRCMPLIGSRYVLFLKSNAESEDFDLITGYELRSGKVFPLDHGPDSETSSPQFAEYERYSGVDEMIFFAELQCVISEGSRR